MSSASRRISKASSTHIRGLGAEGADIYRRKAVAINVHALSV